MVLLPGKVNSSFAQTLGVPGIILPYGSTSAPTGYLSCDGQYQEVHILHYFLQ